MKRLIFSIVFAAMSLSPALASDAQTSATTGTRPGHNGVASGSASYSGDQGFARTDSHSGPISTARGVAVGVDENGLSLSLSQAFAPQHGPAIAVNFNMAIGDDGRVSSSSGLSLANGGVSRTVGASGSAATNRASGASSEAGGETVRGGTVNAWTRADDSRGRALPLRAGERTREEKIDGRVLSIRSENRERERRDLDGRLFRESRFEKLAWR